jgi:hypothetical protein
MNELNSNGYIIIKNKMSIVEQTSGLSCMNGNKVNYTILKSFIDNIFLPKTPFSDPVYLKARISNNKEINDSNFIEFVI